MPNTSVRMLVACAALFALASLVAVVAAETEPNGNFTTANPITPGTYFGDVTLMTDEDDFYSFSVGPGQGIELTVTSPGNDYIYLTLYTWETLQVWQIKSKGSVPETRIYYTANETGTNTWYVQLGVDLVSGAYEFNLTLLDPDDAGTHLDAGGSFSSAALIAPGPTLSGHVADLDMADYYAFTAGAGDAIVIWLTGFVGSDNITLELFTPDKVSVFDLKSTNQQAASAAYYTANETPVGLWFLEAYFGTQAGGYFFNVTLAHQNDMGTGGDAGGNVADATTIGAGQGHGVVRNLDKVDYYRFWAGHGDFFKVELLAQTTTDFITAEVRDKDDVLLFVVKSKLQTAHEDSLYTKNETVPAWWYIKVYYEAEAGEYELTLTIGRQDDAGSGFDASETAASACVVSPGVLKGHLQGLDDFDFYKFQAGRGDVIHLGLECGVVGDYIYATMMDAAETSLFEIKAAAEDPGAGSFLTARETAPTWWFVKVNMVTQPGDYTINLTIVKQDDAGSGGDAAATLPDATSVQGGAFSGQLGDLDAADCFSFPVKGAWKVTVNVTNEQAVSCTVAVFGDSAGLVPVGTISSAGGAKGSGTWDVPTDVAAGTLWYIKAAGSSGWLAGAYAVELYVKETPPDQETPMITFTDPTGATAGEALTLTATVTDNVAVANVTLYFKMDNAVSWTPVVMAKGQDDQYTGTIPGAAIAGTTLKFFIIAKDTSGNDRSHGSEASPRLVQVTPPDTTPPVITYKPPSSVTKEKAFTFSVAVTDNVGVKDVTLYYKIDDEVTWSTVNMTLEGGKWVATIPGATMKGKTLHYYILARDTSNLGEYFGTEANPKSISIKKPSEPGFGVAAAAAAALVAALAAAHARRRR